MIYHWISSISLLLPFPFQFLSTNTRTPNLILKTNFFLIYNRRCCLIPMQTISHRLKPIIIHIIWRYGWDRVFGSPNLYINSICILPFKSQIMIIFSQSHPILVIRYHIQSRSTNSYNQHITLIQPLLKLSVKRNRSRTPTVRRHFNSQHRTIREQHLSKR